MAQRAKPNIGAGNDPTTKDRGMIGMASTTGEPRGRKMARTSDKIGSSTNEAAPTVRRAPNHPRNA